MKKQTNTSNKELREQEREQTIYENKLKKQGYAKALDAVKEIVKKEMLNVGWQPQDDCALNVVLKEIAKLSHSQQSKSKTFDNAYQETGRIKGMKGSADTHIPKIKARIAKLEQEHKIHNGFSIDECGYDECIDRDIRTKLRAKLKEKTK